MVHLLRRSRLAMLRSRFCRPGRRRAVWAKRRLNSAGLSDNPGSVNGNVYTVGDPGQYTVTAVSAGGVRSNPLKVQVFECDKIVIDSAYVAVHDDTKDADKENAFDGDINSICVMRDNPGTRDYETGFTVDLGAMYNMTALSLAFEGACSQNYVIDFSTDGENFGTPFEYNGEEGVKELRERSLHSTEPMRYARSRSTRAATDYGVKLRGFSLYALPTNPTGVGDVTEGGDLFWAHQIAVNRLIFSYFYFLNKQPISNFQHILCFWASVR